MKIRLLITACLALASMTALFAGRAPAQETVDYAGIDNWLAAPAEPELPVDVFYLYSDSCSGRSPCAVGDPAMRVKARAVTAAQASAFETVGNIFVPFYRQAGEEEFLSAPAEAREGLLALPIADAAAAFDYYFQNFNKGRPFILASHSQGTLVMLSGILSGYFKTNPEARKLMVAAYCLGYSVTADYLSDNPHLKFAERRDDTGVIISYNTEAPNLGAANPVVLPRSVAINPVLWTRSSRPAKSDDSLGANLAVFDGESTVPSFADARVNLKRGVVECSTADKNQRQTPGGLFPAGAFHSGDFAFYYYDLLQNAHDRAAAFQRNYSGGS